MPSCARRDRTAVKAGFDGRGGAGVVAGIEGLLGLLRVVGDGGESGGQRGRRIRAGILRQGGQAGVDAVEQRGLVLLRLARDRRCS